MKRVAVFRISWRRGAAYLILKCWRGEIIIALALMLAVVLIQSIVNTN